MIPERRGSPRFAPKEFTFIQLEQEFSGRILNLSENGLCLESVSPLPETDCVQFWFSYPTMGQVNGVGKLIWLCGNNSRAGIHFVHLSRSSRQNLNACLQHLKASIPPSVLEREFPPAGNPRSPESNSPPNPKPDAVPPIHAPGGSASPLAPVSVRVDDAPFPRRRKWPTSLPVEDVPKDSPPPVTVAPFPEPFLPVSSTDAALVGDSVQASATPNSTVSTPAEVAAANAAEQTDNFGTELIPLGRHLSALRSQLWRGALLGIFLCAVIAVPFFRLSRPGWKPTPTGGTLSQAVSANSSSVSSVGNSLTHVAAPAAADALRAGSHKSRNASFPRPSPQRASLSTSAGSDPATLVSQPSPAAGAPVQLNRYSFSPSTPPSSLPSSSSSLAANSARPLPKVDLNAASLSFHPTTTVDINPIGGDAHPAKLIRSVPPVYPDDAKIQHISGDVVLEAEIDPTGKVANARVLSGPVRLRQAALRAVENWRYQPALLNGKPTNSHVTITIQFRLQ